MIDLILIIISFLVFLAAKLLKENVKTLGKSITLLAYSAMFCTIFVIGGTVDEEVFFKKTAFSIILIYVMVITCAVYVWKAVSKLQDL